LRRLQAEKLRHYLRTVVLPFSAHYRGQFRELGLNADSIRTSMTSRGCRSRARLIS